MASPRPQKTLADYLAIAVTPVLIMLLVGSLVFFLHEALYSGSYNSRLRWILFWFVFGSVLIARIAMESGRAQAGFFTLALGGAVALAIMKFVPGNPLVPIAFLALIWWCTDKLTWDCTLIDDSEDASGEGLLQVAGVAEEPELRDAAAGQTPGTPDAPKIPVWKRLLLNMGERKGRPHAPGLWVVYFSLAALPVFGIGQTLIPATDERTRRFAFQCLLVYVAAGLGLLLLTSFLGLRRYLRQRNMQMPTSMAATWVGFGVSIAAGILIVCLLLPRPQGEYSITEAVDRASELVQDASDRAFLKEDGAQQGEDRSGPQHELAQNNPPENEPSDDEDQSGQNQSGQNQSGQNQSGQNQSGQNQSGQNQPGQNQPGQNQPGQNQSGQNQTGQEQSGQNQAGQEQSGPEQQAAEQQNSERQTDESESSSEEATPPESSSLTESLAQNTGLLFKLVIYGLAALAGLYFLIRHRHAVLDFLRRMWADLCALFGGRRISETVGASDEPAEDQAPVRPFSSYQNPFQSGLARQASATELVRYTFEALQAWAVEHDCPRRMDQTPLEFGEQLRSRRIPCATEASEFTQLYARVAYAGHQPGPDQLPLLEQLWRKLSQTSQAKKSVPV